MVISSKAFDFYSELIYLTAHKTCFFFLFLVDIVFAHRLDPDVPMLEIVRAFNSIIDSGKAFYWATSEWPAEAIEEAFRELVRVVNDGLMNGH